MSTLVLVHVIISLVAIVAGLVVMFGLLGSKSMPGLTAIFLALTILTNATGLVIPPLITEKLLPSQIIAILSLVLLAIACIALYAMHLKGAWRPIYIVTAMVSLYLNCFVLVIQSFLKIPALQALAPAVPPNPPGGPVFGAVQGIVLVFFVLVIIGIWRRYRPVTFA